MFHRKCTEKTNAGRAAIWALYRDVPRWSEWDAGIERASLDGGFSAGSRGVMVMDGGRELPFVIESATPEREFTVRSDAGGLSVRISHEIGEGDVTHSVTVEGGADGQADAAGEGIAAGMQAALDRLLALAAE